MSSTSTQSPADRPSNGVPERTARTGMCLGCLAVLFWSFGSTLIYLGARELGTWSFVAISSTTGGILQLISRRVYHGELRSSLLLPWRLWAGPLLFFVLYGLAWPSALATCNPRQAGAVNLINYLWPILTVVFSIVLVPGLRLTRTIAVAMILAAAGLFCANATPLRELFRSGTQDADFNQWLPFVLASVAAVTWAAYSAVLVRWRSWATNYVTSPVGFLLIALISSGILIGTGAGPLRLSISGLVTTLVYGAGPLAAGYLLWELALPRARVESLSVVAAATPVLSTIVLACSLRAMPEPSLIAAALLISGGVALSMKRQAPALKAGPAEGREDTGTLLPRPKDSRDRVPGTS